MYAIDNPKKIKAGLSNLIFCGWSSSDLTNEPIKKKDVLNTFNAERKNITYDNLFRISTNISYFFKAEISSLSS